jgi:ABC-2 type transport system ATP-binding protein
MKLQAQSLCVARSGKDVLSGVSFSVNAGEVYALLGGNGAGKSTTLLSVLGFLPIASGRIRISNKEASCDIATARQAISYLPESASLYEHLNANENLDYFLQLAGNATCQQAMSAALDQVSLAPEVRLNKLRTYSKGMRQKVAIALAILRDTDILLLDEPTSGLDPSAIDEFHHTVLGLMVTHDVYGACQVADKIGMLHGGTLVGEFSASGNERINTETVHRAFSATAHTSKTTLATQGP